MKIVIPPVRSIVFAGYLVAIGFGASPRAQGQSAQPAATVSPTPSDGTAHGQFRSSDGTSGTYVETYVVTDATATDSITYTLADSTESRTENLVTTTNSDGTKTVDYDELDFGTATPFKSTTAYTISKGGSAVGTGIFIAANGTTGVLAAVVARNGQISITSTDFTSSAGTLTRQVKLEEKGDGVDVVKTLDVDAAGTLTTTNLTRSGGMHHQHP